MNVVHKQGSLIPKSEQEGKTEAFLNLYNENPNVELSLDDFELYALKRLKVLRKIEHLKSMRAPVDVARAKIDQLIKRELSDSKIDEISHFILRISYCQSEELRRWFLQYESALFQHRLRNLSDSNLAHSVRGYAQLKPISKTEQERLKDHLMMLITPTEFATSTFYAVPFQQALELVATRQCFLSGGYAYVPHAKVIPILAAKFRSELSRRLTSMAAAGSFTTTEDPETKRVYPLLQNLSHCLLSTEPDVEMGISPNQMLNASNVGKFVNNMPLCMRQLQTGLDQDKKLRHWGRQQYGLFLKGAGLSMDDALLFFQRHFQRVTGEEFQKQYSYNIRHMYGKEGKRANYTPHSCMKIIMGNAPSASGDHHGCPFKHYDNDNLNVLLQRLQVGTSTDRSAIMSLKKANQFQMACQKHFEVMHPHAVSMDIPMDNVGNHPNAWFRASVAYSERVQQSSPDEILSVKGARNVSP